MSGEGLRDREQMDPRDRSQSREAARSSGLEPPEAMVTLEVKGQAAPRQSRRGGKSPPASGSTPARKQAGGGRHRRLRSPRESRVPVAEFRDRALFTFDAERHRRVDLTSTIEDTSRPRRAASGASPSPVRTRRPPDLIEGMLDKLASATVTGIRRLGEVHSRTYGGLDKPSRLTLWLGKDKDRTSKTLLWARSTPRRKRRVRPARGRAGSAARAERDLGQAAERPLR